MKRTRFPWSDNGSCSGYNVAAVIIVYVGGLKSVPGAVATGFASYPVATAPGTDLGLRQSIFPQTVRCT